jgi:ABC-type lipoprotein release transport system permease subunit
MIEIRVKNHFVRIIFATLRLYIVLGGAPFITRMSAQ